MRPVCAHDGYYDIHTSYDRERQVLIFLLTCECCGATVREVRRESYHPVFDRHGHERYAGYSTAPKR